MRDELAAFAMAARIACCCAESGRGGRGCFPAIAAVVTPSRGTVIRNSLTGSMETVSIAIHGFFRWSCWWSRAQDVRCGQPPACPANVPGSRDVPATISWSSSLL